MHISYGIDYDHLLLLLSKLIFVYLEAFLPMFLVFFNVIEVIIQVHDLMSRLIRGINDEIQEAKLSLGYIHDCPVHQVAYRSLLISFHVSLVEEFDEQ